MRDALHHEHFGPSWRLTAGLYAELFAVTAPHGLPPATKEPHGGRAGWGPVAFDLATFAFQEELSLRLVDSLERELALRLEQIQRPRQEVQRLIADWIGHWQRGLPNEEALRRASLLMKAMPAWSKN